MLFLRRKVPQLIGTGVTKEDQMRPTAHLQTLLPETVQTILKCISASKNNLSQELSQEIFQMNIQAKLALDKPNNLNLAQQQQLQNKQGQNTLMGGNQGTFDMLQSLFRRLYP